MSMRKAFRVSFKNSTSGPYSVLLENRNREETLLFESGAVAVLCKSFRQPSIEEGCKSSIFHDDFFSASKEKEIVKKMYTMLLDAYGCLGILQVCAPGNQYFLESHLMYFCW